VFITVQHQLSNREETIFVGSIAASRFGHFFRRQQAPVDQGISKFNVIILA